MDTSYSSTSAYFSRQPVPWTVSDITYKGDSDSRKRTDWKNQWWNRGIGSVEYQAAKTSFDNAGWSRNGSIRSGISGDFSESPG